MLILTTNCRHLIWRIIVVFCTITFIGKRFIVANNVHVQRDAVINASKLNAKPYSFYNERIEMITDYFEVPKKVNRNNVSGSSSSNTNSNRNQNNMLITKNKCRTCQTKTTTQSQTTWFWSARLRNEVWSLPVLVFALLVMFLIGCFEVFVVCKAWSTTPSRRHLFLGQMLLLGLFLCAGIGAILSIQPTVATCALVRFGVGVSYALVFASLLVKCVFLISLNSGVYLPAPYQALLLFFAVLMQLAIATQWLLHTPPLIDLFTLDEVVSSHRRSFISTTPTSLSPSLASSSLLPDSTHFADTITLCRSSFIDMIFSLVYVIFLLIFVAFLAVKSRHIRDNYREAVFICLSVFVSGFVWFSWIVIGILINERHKDACLAFGLIFTAISIFLFMFMPKGRQLAALGKDGVYLEDRADDRFSSSSRGAYSGYSPSFFHFKPMSCDFDTPATCHNYKHHHPATVSAFANGPDRLVSYPAPPSYKKFFQYYPNSISQYYYPPRLSSGVFVRPDDGNFYTTLEPTLSTNPNVYFHPRKGFHSGMIY